MTVYVLCFFQMTTFGPVFKYACYHTKTHEDDVESTDGLFPMTLITVGAVSLSRAYDKIRQRCPHDLRLMWLVPYLDLLERGEKIYSDTEK